MTTLIEHVRDIMAGTDAEADDAIRTALITKAADAADSYERGCAGWALAQQLWPGIREDEWLTRHGEAPECNGESLRGVDHLDGCGKCQGDPYGCCSYCSDCDRHHDEDGDEYRGGVDYCDQGHCHDCDHHCDEMD